MIRKTQTRSFLFPVLLLSLTSFTSRVFGQSTGVFNRTGDMTTARAGHTATLLPDGRVLIVGGASQGPLAEAYDPSTGAFSPADDMTTSRDGHPAILLPDGNVIILGGIELQDGRTLIVSYPNAEVYDPASGMFTLTGAYADPSPVCDTATLLLDGRVLLTGCAAQFSIGATELFDPQTGTFSLTSPTTTLCYGAPTPIYARAATLLWSGRVLLIGGSNQGVADDCGWFAAAELYDPLAEKFQADGQMSRPRYNHSATLLPDGTVFIAGGGPARCDFTGCYFGGTTASAESYDPLTHRFTFLGNMIAPRAGQSATLLMNGTVFLAGGYSGGSGVLRPEGSQTAEIYTPPVPLPMPVVTDLQFNPSSIAAGLSYSSTIAGSNLTPLTFFDVRLRPPGSARDVVALNWQKGTSSIHLVPSDTATGIWTITGVRAHEVETDHTGIFFPVSATLTVLATNAVPDHMAPGDFLLPGQFRQSADGRFRLVYQVDGNLVLYQGSNPLWDSKTQSAIPGFAVMQGDGNFVVYDSTGPVWWSRTWAPGAFLVVQNDGNTVIYSTGSLPLWATNTCCRQFGISGVYDLTFTASPACTNLPNELKTRKYTATITQYSPPDVFGNVRVTLSDSTFAGPQGYCALGDRFWGTIANDAARFEIETNSVPPCEDWGGLPAIIEWIAPGSYFGIKGNAQGSMAEGTISGRLEGSFQLHGRNDFFGPPIAACPASDHTFVMRRR